MSRSFKHTKKDSKFVSGILVAYFFSHNWSKERNVKKCKGGIILQEEDSSMQNYRNGQYSFGISKDFRKIFNKKQKNKMKMNLQLALKNEEYDLVGKEKHIKDAGRYFY